MSKKVPQEAVTDDEADDCCGYSTSQGLPEPSQAAMDALILNVCTDRGIVLFGSLSAQATDSPLFNRAEEA